MGGGWLCDDVCGECVEGGGVGEDGDGVKIDVVDEDVFVFLFYFVDVFLVLGVGGFGIRFGVIGGIGGEVVEVVG